MRLLGHVHLSIFKQHEVHPDQYSTFRILNFEIAFNDVQDLTSHSETVWRQNKGAVEIDTRDKIASSSSSHRIDGTHYIIAA